MEAIERVFNSFHLIILNVVRFVQQMGEQMEEDCFTGWCQQPFLQIQENLEHEFLREMLTKTLFEDNFPIKSLLLSIKVFSITKHLNLTPVQIKVMVIICLSKMQQK